MTNTGKPYERLTQRVFQAILEQEGVTTIKVEHDVKVQGRTTEHQIDVLWRFTQGPVEHLVIVQCKDWTNKVDQGAVLLFRAVLDDIPGQPRGLIVTRTGFQEGALAIAEAHGIALFELREPADADWKRRIRTIITAVTLYEPEFKFGRMVVDEEWGRAECKSRGFSSTNEVSFRFAGSGAELVFVDDEGKRLASADDLCNELTLESAFREHDWVTRRYDFAQAAYYLTGESRFPRVKILAVEADIRLTAVEGPTIEIRGDEIVRFILVDVLRGKRTVFDADVKPVASH